MARLGDRRGVHRVLAGNPYGNRPLGRLRCTWANNIKMDLKKVGWERRTGLIWLRIGTGGGRLRMR